VRKIDAAPYALNKIISGIRLRYYQNDVKTEIYNQWAAGVKNVLAVLPTGGGKTVVFGSILAEEQGASCAIAHRQELVGQISLALARYGVLHKIIGPQNVIKAICREHIAETGRVWYDPNAKCAVAGVDTLIKRGDDLKHWLASVKLWVTDEAHHLLDSNKWGKAAQMFPNARGLGVTATPTRADGRGLGRHAHGVFDTMVLGPTMRQLINEGYLTDYRLIVSKSDIVMNDKPGASGDWSPVQLRAASKESHIIDDVVGRYLKWAPNKLGVTFATDVETATDMAAAFRKAGVTAEVVHAKTPDDIRRSILGRFKRREIMMLINVDLFGEGFDLPAIEVVIMARPTESYSLFAQQFGRVLRLLIDPEYMAVWDDFSVADRLAIIAASTKPAGIVIDLVGAIVRHNGPPDIRNDWTLDARSSKGESKNDAEPLSYCVNPECANVYPKYKKACPFCGHTLPITARNSPEAVAGDLIELDAETLAALRAQLSGVTKSVEDYRMELMAQGLPSIWVMANVKKHDEKCRAYLNLKDASEWLVGEWLAAGLTMSECHRRFYIKFGMDVLSAYALPKADALELANKIDTLLTPASFAARVTYNLTEGN